MTPAIVFVGAGVVLGSDALGVIEVAPSGHVVKALAEATLGLVLFADASRIDLRTLRREATVPARLLGIGLPLTIVAGALVAVALLGELTLLEAVVLAVVLAPTDAALGQAVVTEKRLPSRIRQGLNVESGLNDGICVPLLLIALAAAEVESSQETTGGAVQLVVEQIGYGVVGGVARRGGGGGVADGRTARLDRRRLAAGRAPRRCCCFIRSCSWARRVRVHRSLRRRWRLWISAAPLRRRNRAAAR